ncbi:MAG TPA: glycosyltransferase [Terracidiphilus sp.]|jgi:glycosyltransferase involved in cell wall biosynthesis|nr:glycosyltransferase [Terracidiphilus sp.]
MHIAFLVPTLDRIAGAERQVCLLAIGLKRRGHCITVIALSGTGSDTSGELMRLGIGFRSLGMRKGLADPRGWLRLHRWLLREAPDVLHAHLPHAAWMARWSRLFAHIPVVVDTIHTSSTGGSGRTLGYRCSNWFTDAVTAVSQSVADAYLHDGMVSAARLHILPNGVETNQEPSKPEIRERLRCEVGCKNHFLWLAAGRLETVKDYPTLLRAITLLSKQARLVIAGNGFHEQELRALAVELRLQPRVHFLGFVADLKHWMQAADGFVLSSLWEGLPMGLLEAAACSLPAVATDVPGSRDALTDGCSGFLAPPRNPIALAAAMAKLMQMSPQDRAAMGAEAHRRVNLGFSLESVLDRWERLYTDLLNAQFERRGVGSQSKVLS